MLDRFLVGMIGGISYIFVTWVATSLGILSWAHKAAPPTTELGFTFLAPFSLLGLFLFLTLYLFPKIKPNYRGKRTFKSLLWMGFAFSLGASLFQFPLMYMDGMQLKNIFIVDGIFFLSSLIISILICSFYIFLKPLHKNPKIEPLDELFSK